MKKITVALIAALMFCSITMSLAMAAGTDTSNDETLEEIEKEIEKDFIPDHLLTNTQRNITREEFCATLVSLYEYIEETTALLPTSNPFTDTNNPEVLKAYKLGIVNGMGNGLFCPKQALTVEQKAVMLYKTLLVLDPNIDTDITLKGDFSDADCVSAWAVEAIEYLHHHSIMTVDVNNNVNPKNIVKVEKANQTAKATLEHYNELLSPKTSDDSLSESSAGTQITTPDGYKSIDKLYPGDEVLVADMDFNWSGATIFDVFSGHEYTMLCFKLENNRDLLLASNQLVMRSDKKLVLASKINASTDCLMDKDGNPVKILEIELLLYNDTVYIIRLDKPFDGSPNGHLLLMNDVIVGDFVLATQLRDEQYLGS